jgi:ketosteroid isomerase-like protein
MMKRLAVFALVVGLAAGCFGQTGMDGKTAAKKNAGATVDKAYLQKIWDGWATLDPAGQKQYYAQGPHVFFDIAPLKYADWDEYQAGVVKVLSDFSAGKCTVNDDAQIHKMGDGYWVTATVATDLTHKSGKHDISNMRWTAVFEKHDGRWLIVHEHVSEPME